MKILHLCDKYGGGGDSIAMTRLHRGLLQAGYESRILVARNEPGSSAEHVCQLRPKSLLEKACYMGGMVTGINYAAIPGTARAVRQCKCWDWADVIHINTLHGGYFNYRAIRELGQDKPLVWTLHDMWAMTGHCAYSLDCNRWETGCGNCPHLQIYPAMAVDRSAKEWQWKSESFGTSIKHLVCPSEWLKGLASKSLLGGIDKTCIPYGLDMDVYQPGDKMACRKKLGLPLDKHVLLYASQSHDNPFKDAALMPRILKALKEDIRSQCVLAVMGGGNAELFSEGGMPVFNLGYVAEDVQKADLYRAADILVFPTRADNLPLVIQESMACGCPAVSVDVGGVGEMVIHKSTGMLASPGDASGMAEGITELIQSKGLYDELSSNCRSHAVDKFALPVYVEAVTQIYAQALRAGK